MRRQDIQLLARARQGDTAARCEAARRYLLGAGGFPRHAALGLEYLAHPDLAGAESASVIIAESLALHDLVRLDQLGALRVAAQASSVPAQVKLAAWTSLTSHDLAQTVPWLHRAARAGHAAAAEALRALEGAPVAAVTAFVRALAGEPGFDAAAVLTLALSRALHTRDDEMLLRTLACTLELVPAPKDELSDIVCAVLEYAQSRDRFPLGRSSGRIESLLESCVRRGNGTAALLLGRALCGLDAGPLAATSLVAARNLRKGAALLLRAADAGKAQAWTLLFQVHSDNHASVANPSMARFFLEKAALGGEATAQRRLGALILRSAASVHESEQGIHWLHEAAQRHDVHAVQLLRSLAMQVAGAPREAGLAIDAIRRRDPWMACRLQVARDFGLTRLEALSVDIAAAVRPWGMVVGPNPFINQAKLSAPRAIPALTEEATRNLRRSAAFMEQTRQDGAPPEGDLRKRSARLRHLLQRFGFDEALFFAQARSTTLNTLRAGPKWAFQARQPLRLALAA